MAPIASPILIEVCVDSVQSAINAVKAGADRLELCANLGLGGGTTPTLGLLKAVQNKVHNVPIMVMIRPRTGDFLYSDQELAVILEDVRIFKQFGIRGIVVGALDKDGRVDINHMKQIVDEALPLEICFHRAFDMTRNPDEALRDVESIGGISRILTSGQGRTALEAISTLKVLFTTAEELNDGEPWKLALMAGSGINGETIRPILDGLVRVGLREIHLSGGGWLESEMVFRRNGMGMGVNNFGAYGEWGMWMTDAAKVNQVREIVDNYRTT